MSYEIGGFVCERDNSGWQKTSTGAIGLIGGDYLHMNFKKHHDWNIAALIRDPLKANIVQDVYPSVKIIRGDLDDANILEAESGKADVVLSTLSSHFSLFLHAALIFS